ncbi:MULTISPECIES: transglycosylase SLT domain-containing protein [Kitasatospora]
MPRLSHHKMPDYVLGAGVAGAVLMGTLLPVSQAFADPTPAPAASAPAAAAPADQQAPAVAPAAEDVASRGEARPEAPQPQQQAPQPQAQPDQAQQQAPQQQAQPQPAQPKPEQPKPQPQPAQPKPQPQKPSYSNNLDGWIREARDILAANGKPVPSYKAMYATAMAESTGNPRAVNGWDSNAKSGTPSIGLTQMIQPTFRVYALPGHTDIRNPVDNLIASSRYCDATYGGMDKMAAARGYGSHWRGY